MGKRLKEHYVSGRKMALENSNGGLSFNNNLNGLGLCIKIKQKPTNYLHTHNKEKEKSSVTGHDASKDFICFDFFK